MTLQHIDDSFIGCHCTMRCGMGGWGLVHMSHMNQNQAVSMIQYFHYQVVYNIPFVYLSHLGMRGGGGRGGGRGCMIIDFINVREYYSGNVYIYICM